MIYGMVVGRNEADRYLQTILTQMMQVLDQCFFFDDNSDDDTADIAQDLGCLVARHQPGTVRFMEDEGMFRETAWRVFGEVMKPTMEDWVLVFDCDQVLFAYEGSTQSALRTVVATAGSNSVMVKIHEVFGFDHDGIPLVRMDSLWDTVIGPRLFRYQGDGSWRYGRFGVPGEPSYVHAGPLTYQNQVYVLHYGYAEVADQLIKYNRYKGEPGHDPGHIESIIGPKICQRWESPHLELP